MSSVNKVFLLGNLGRDPETRYTADGAAVTNFSMATTRKWKDASGQLKEETEWSRCCAFGRLAEVAGEYLKKGAKVHVEGRLRTREWEKDGVKHYTTEIVIEQLTMLDSRRDSDSSAPRAQAQRPARVDSGSVADLDEDIPF